MCAPLTAPRCAQTAFLLLYGQILTLFDRRWTFIAAIAIFEIGSLLCGAAPNVNVLIFARAFAGCGAAGIFVSVLSIIATTTRLEDRPKLLVRAPISLVELEETKPRTLSSVGSFRCRLWNLFGHRTLAR